MTRSKTTKEKMSRFEAKDAMRLAIKAVLASRGKVEISEASASAAEHIVVGYFDQNTEDKRRAGQVKKRKEGIWLATIELIKDYPDATASELWEKMPDVELEDPRWGFMIDGEKLEQTLGDPDSLKTKTSSIKFGTFQKEYFSKAKKFLRDKQK